MAYSTINKLDKVAPLITDPSSTRSTSLVKKKYDMWHLTPDMWHVTGDMWHKIHRPGGGDYCVYNGLEVMMVQRLGGKGGMTQRINELMKKRCLLNRPGYQASINCLDARMASWGQSQFCEAKIDQIYNFIKIGFNGKSCKGQWSRVWPYRSKLASEAVTELRWRVQKSFFCPKKSKRSLFIAKFWNATNKGKIFKKQRPEATRKTIPPCRLHQVC